MAVPKAVATLGIGRENLHYIPISRSGSIDPVLTVPADATTAIGFRPSASVYCPGAYNDFMLRPGIGLVFGFLTLQFHVPPPYLTSKYRINQRH